jgi:hypothetical protein
MIDRVHTYAEWHQLREAFVSAVGERFATYISPAASHFDAQFQFATGRFDEGMGLVRYFLGGGHLAASTCLT